MSDAAPTLDTIAPQPPETLAAARAALGRHAWQEAFDGFNAADAEAPLSGEDLDSLATAAFFSGQAKTIVATKERAFQAHSAAGDVVRAASAALDAAREYALADKPSLARGWFRRAEKLLEGQPEGPAHAALALALAWQARRGGRGRKHEPADRDAQRRGGTRRRGIDRLGLIRTRP